MCQRGLAHPHTSSESWGPNAGKSFVAPASLQPAHYNDEEFVEVLRWLLDLVNQGITTVCRNLAAKTMTECGEELDSFGDHAATCLYGPLRIKRHDNIADCLSDMVTETGAHVRREAYVRAFSTPASEAWLDIWAFAGLRIQDLLVDVTIRHPMASAYHPAASRNDSAAAEQAEQAKLERYPPCDLDLLFPSLWKLGAVRARRRSIPCSCWPQKRHCITAAVVKMSAQGHSYENGAPHSTHKSVAMSLISMRCELPGKPYNPYRAGGGHGR